MSDERPVDARMGTLQDLGAVVGVHWWNERSPWWSVPQASEYLNCSPRGVYDLVKHNKIRHVRLFTRREVRVRREWLDEFLEQRATPETATPVAAGRRRAS